MPADHPNQTRLGISSCETLRVLSISYAVRQNRVIEQANRFPALRAISLDRSLQNTGYAGRLICTLRLSSLAEMWRNDVNRITSKDLPRHRIDPLLKVCVLSCEQSSKAAMKYCSAFS